LPEANDHCDSAPPTTPGPKTRMGVATCRKRMIIATRGATEASDTLPEVHDCDLWRGWHQLHPDVLRLSPYRSAIFSLRTRTFARAAFVSPPWFSEPHLQVQCDQFPRFELACEVHFTGGLRPPLLVGNASAGRIMRIPAANSTGTSLRSGTRPAHMRIPSADSIRSPRGAYAPRSWLHARHIACDMRFRFATADVLHGGLTLPAHDARAGGVSAGAHAVRGLFVREWFLFASRFRLLLALFGSQPGLT
jgi:hypothetical protein